MVFDRQQHQEAVGENIQQAGRDLYSLTIQLPDKRRDSAIEKVVSGLYDITGNQELSFTPPDTQTYTVHDKILHNKLETYRQFYDQFTDVYPLVQHKINIASTSDLSFRIKVIRYVQGVHRKTVMALQPATLNGQGAPDWIIEKMSCEIQQDLQNCGASITLEELQAVDYVIFYVFAECKIFDKPPIKQR